MIRNTIIAALLFFAGYNLYLYYAKPVPGPGQHQWQKNMILMQDYADDHAADPVVIVGTSLSARLYNNMLPKGYYNLAVAGGSIYEGLALVKQNPHKPKILLIESNLFYKDPDKEAVSGVFDPDMRKLRKWIPSSREENQPANLITPMIGKVGQKNNTGNSNDTSITNMLLRQRIRENQVLPDSGAMRRNLKLLTDYIQYFQGQGVKVILYEIPENCQLYATPRYSIPKQLILHALPESSYHWMPAADCHAYTYSDGSHMAYESAGDFVKWFVGEVGKEK